MGTEEAESPDVGAPEADAAQEEEAAQGPSSSRYAGRKYNGDRSRAKLKQWFAPLPNRPKVMPLDRAELEERAAGAALTAAEQLLEEATAVWAARQGRIQTVEAKATTLLGAVAIAASLVIAGSGLILDPAKVDDGWREALMVLVALLLACLLQCGAMASRALLKVHKVSRPQIRHALQRAKESDANKVRIRRAVDLMARAGENLYIADYKLAHVRVAYRWYRLALLFFLLLGATIAAYVLSGDLPPPGR